MTAILVVIGSVLASCRLDPLPGGDSVALSFYVPTAYGPGDGPGSKAVTPSTVRVHVTVTGSDMKRIDRDYDVQGPGTATLAVTNIPKGSDRVFTVTTIDKDGETITTGTITLNLDQPENTVKIPLKPVQLPVVNGEIDYMKTNTFTVTAGTIPAGKTVFGTLTFRGFPAGVDFQIFQTGVDPIWMDICDETGQPVTATARDHRGTWLVFRPVNDKQYSVFLSSPNNRNQAAVITLNARRAYFVRIGSAGVSPTGTSDDPFKEFNQTTHDDYIDSNSCVILSGGSYPSLSLLKFLHIYGGFDSNWKRDLEDNQTTFTASQPTDTYTIKLLGAGTLDGITIIGPGSATDSNALYTDITNSIRVSDCVISAGSALNQIKNAIHLDGGNATYPTVIERCTIDGGSFTTGTTTGIRNGIRIATTAAANLIIRECEISGASTDSATIANVETNAVSIKGDGTILLARNRIFGGKLTPSAGSKATVTGIDCSPTTATTGTLTIVSNAICGGAITTASSDTSIVAGITLDTNHLAANIIGNTIDSGWAATTACNQIGIGTVNDGKTINVRNNVFMTASTGSTYGAYTQGLNSNQFIYHNDFFGFGVAHVYGVSNYFAQALAGQTELNGKTGCAGNIRNDLSSNMSGYVSGYTSVSALSEKAWYPAGTVPTEICAAPAPDPVLTDECYFDLSGKPRPKSIGKFWTMGAFELN